MPWCPKCKMEYQEGITECPDCKLDLVDSIEEAVVFVPFVQTEDKKIAEKLSHFLEYSNLKSELSFDEENEVYVVSVDPKKEKQARKLYQAFYYVERDNQMKTAMEELGKKKSEASEEALQPSSDDADMATEDGMDDRFMDDAMYEQEDSSSDEDYEPEITDEEFTGMADEDRNTTSYVMKADQYKDLAGTVWIFLLFGIGGLIVVLLNVLGVLSFFNGFLPITVMSALFLFFIYIAISTNQKAKKIQAGIDAENKLSEKIIEWLKTNVTQSFLASIHNDNISEELNYIKKTDTIKEMLIKEFGNQNLAYLDRMIEEYYSSYIENTEE